MPEAREEAEQAAAGAEEALKRLDDVLAAALTARAVAEPGLEARGIYWALEAFSKARVKELEQEHQRNQRQKKLLLVLRNVALGLLLICTPLREYGPGGTRRSQEEVVDTRKKTVSPELLKPLVDVVATMGKLGATTGHIPLAKPWGSLRAGLLTFRSGMREALIHRDGQAARLSRALAPPTTEGPSVPTASPVAIASEWLKAVATVEAAWAKLKAEATSLRDACAVVAATGASAGATAEAAVGKLMGAMALEAEACKRLGAATHLLPMALEPAEAAEAVTAHDARLAEAQAGLQEASKATEEVAVAAVAAVTAKERGQQAAVAHELLGQLVVACDGARRYYCHLQRRLKDIEAMVAAGHGAPEAAEVAQEGPDVPEATQGDAGSPKGLEEAVKVAGALWVASARLAQQHLLGTLKVLQVLLNTDGTAEAEAEAAALARRCQDATRALPELLPAGLS
ncbi:translation initiation factor IF-2-like protein [Aix galericulata]|nr:translation initiation factor IF-2-like protein [Aix galericulata]